MSLKLKMKYTAEPWYYIKNNVTGPGNVKVCEVNGLLLAEEKNDNVLLISCAPLMLKAILAEEAYNCMESSEGSAILESLGYREGSKYDFVKSLRKKALTGLGLI